MHSSASLELKLYKCKFLDLCSRWFGVQRVILMASVSVSAAHVSVSVLVSEVPDLSTGSREPASVSRPASRPNLDGLGLGHGHPCLGLGLGGPGLDYNPA